MAIRLDDGFFQRAASLQTANCRHELSVQLQTQMAIDARDAAAADDFNSFFAELWDEATVRLGLTDCVTITKYFNIRLTQDRWGASDLHRNYVHSMLGSEEQFIRIEDGIAAVHQNIIEQHYAK
jgi:hypothetical protein